MTFIGVTNFFDKRAKHIGYALVSDSRLGVTDIESDYGKLERQEEARVTKHFSGDNFIGLVSGAIGLRTEGTHEETYAKALNSLNGLFRDIEHGQIFDLPVVSCSKETTLVIAQRGSSGVALFTVESQFPKNEWTAKLIHAGAKASYHYGRSQIWYGPFDGELREIPLDRRLSPVEAQSGLVGLLTSEHTRSFLGYDPSPINLYFISPEKHGKVEGTQLVSL